MLMYTQTVFVKGALWSFLINKLKLYLHLVLLTELPCGLTNVYFLHQKTYAKTILFNSLNPALLTSMFTC